jgi:hypothetical protein
MRGVIAPRAAAAREFLVIVALAAIGISTSLPAQPLSPATSRSLIGFSVDSISNRDSQFRNRLVPAAIGGLAGAATLGFAGYWIAGGCTRKCDVFTWDEVILGGFAGAILGSTLGAARPRGRELCTREQRLGMGLGGAFLGAVAALGLAQIPNSRPAVIVTIPLGSVKFMGGC